MSPEALFTLAVTIGALILFVTEVVSIDVVGLLVVTVLVLFGVLDVQEGLSGFSSDATITIACMFVLSAGLIRAGALEFISRLMFKLGEGSKPRLVVALMLSVAVSSAFVNNTPVAVLFLPIVLGVAGRLGVAPSRLLLPMSYASILGGTCTLIGTSTNLLVGQVAAEHGFGRIGIFDFSIPGMIFAALGFLYLATFGRLLLPQHASVTPRQSDGRIREFVTEVMFQPDSPLVGRSFQEILAKSPGITPLMLIRGEEVYPAPLVPNPRTQFARGGDVLLLRGDPGAINSILEKEGVTLPPELGAMIEQQGAAKTYTMVELVINPNSPLLGRRLSATDFARHYGNAGVVAVLRREEHLRERLSELRLQLGDTLLVVCDENAIDHLRDGPEFILLEGVDKRLLRRDKAPLAVAIMALVVGLATLTSVPLSTLALTGVVLMLLTGCLPARQAYESIDWSVIMLIVGMIGLGHAMERTQLAHIAAMGLVDLLRDTHPVAVLAGIYVVTAVLTSLISNTAVALLLTPIALDVAASMGFQPAPFLFAVLFGASACFATPMGYQTNLFVYGPGGYRFRDFLRVGVPLNLLLFLAAMAVIPWYWPLTRI